MHRFNRNPEEIAQQREDRANRVLNRNFGNLNMNDVFDEQEPRIIRQELHQNNADRNNADENNFDQGDAEQDGPNNNEPENEDNEEDQPNQGNRLPQFDDDEISVASFGDQPIHSALARGVAFLNTPAGLRGLPYSIERLTG